MKIPKEIKGYGFVYPVILKKKVKDKEGTWLGLIKHRQGIIELDKNMHHRAIEANLLHEIMHFVNAEERTRLNEDKIEKLGRGLYQVLKDSGLLK